MYALTQVLCKNAQPKTKDYKLSDGKGLYLLVRPNGAKYWRLKYRFDGKEKTLSLGVYPEVGLKEARDKRDAARKSLRAGVDPGAKGKKTPKDPFEAVAREWWSKQKLRWKDNHAGRVIESFEKDIFPDLGQTPINSIKAPALLMTLRKIEARQAFDLANRMRQRCEAVFSYGIATGRCERNPAVDLKGALATPKIKHYNWLSAAQLPAFIRVLDNYDGSLQTKLGIQLLMLTFVRTLELRGAKWGEINFEGKEWRIPAERMKRGQEHIVPLSGQALDAFRRLHELNGNCPYVFTNRHHSDKPMSENTLLYGIYRLGYHTQMTGHGFRTTASTILNEMGFSPDAIERQLAHVSKDKIRGIYNRAQYLPERRTMMQVWADYLDSCAGGATVIPIRSA